MKSRPLVALVLVLAVLSPSCESPKASSAGRRIGTDAWVTFTSPVQLPAMSFRDAANYDTKPVYRVLLFPLTFPIYLVEHAVLTTVHAVDLVISPIHFFNDWEPLRVYQADTFPMQVYPEATKSFETGFTVIFVLVGTALLTLALSG